MRWGCEDCGKTWRTKSDVTPRCLPYVGRIKRVPVPGDPHEIRYVWADS